MIYALVIVYAVAVADPHQDAGPTGLCFEPDGRMRSNIDRNYVGILESTKCPPIRTHNKYSVDRSDFGSLDNCLSAIPYRTQVLPSDAEIKNIACMPTQDKAGN